MAEGVAFLLSGPRDSGSRLSTGTEGVGEPRRRPRLTDHGTLAFGKGLPLHAWKDVRDFEVAEALLPFLSRSDC